MEPRSQSTCAWVRYYVALIVTSLRLLCTVTQITLLLALDHNVTYEIAKTEC